MSDTPLYSALCALAKQKRLRFHMPGHKGNPLYMDSFPDASLLDYTELPQTGNLYLGDGPISDAERLAAEYYGAANGMFLTGGATQGIMTALALSCRNGDAILMDRGCHRSVANACGLLGLNHESLYPDLLPGSSLAGTVSKETVFGAVKKAPHAKAVVLTSPTYYGAVADIGQIADAVHAAGMILIVDEAHGAHFPAIGMKSAVQQGADLAVCSAHKTISALTQGAYLFANDAFSTRDIFETASVFGTSSPSYIIMASLDLARAYLCGEGGEKYRRAAEMTAGIKEKIQKNTGFRIPAFYRADPCRLTIETAACGIGGVHVAERLRSDYRIDCEMADACHVVFIVTSEDSEETLDSLYRALFEIYCGSKKESRGVTEFFVPKPVKILPICEAMLSKTKRVFLKDAQGRTAARPLCPYPPGVPAVLPGERIDRLCIEYLLSRGYNEYDEIAITDLADKE